MGHLTYNKVGNRSSTTGKRCFRLNPKRFSVQRLRAKFLYVFRIFSKWRCLYGHDLESIKKGVIKRSSNSRKESSSKRNLVTPNVSRADYRLRSFGRSNSFYSEAIADCLEFIKRTSISVDEYKSVDQV
ncbi:hypothetical protein LOK49_LG04G01399 [Camellia lanceoleosa]|uniref:Uncharacterized protein n=1 Tax=Camellia lanceoleosa TaxID=1840588 RepID=A0ACC0I7E2_9ERIC|nr:hypothetical protein LOK49_LG04G01399 [Camellia lanceoleosa]